MDPDPGGPKTYGPTDPDPQQWELRTIGSLVGGTVDTCVSKSALQIGDS
jgi:hypothetical protein